jgi:hypothetical protein
MCFIQRDRDCKFREGKLWYHTNPAVRRGAEKFLAFPIFLFATQPKELFLEGLKKLEQRSHKRVELRGEYVE